MLNWAKKVGLLCDNRNVKTTEQMYQRGDRTEMFAPITLAIEAQAKLTATPPDIDDWMFMDVRKVKTLEGSSESFPFPMVDLACYKHRLTRQYVCIDDRGQCWMKPETLSVNWVKITNGLAFDKASAVGVPA